MNLQNQIKELEKSLESIDKFSWEIDDPVEATILKELLIRAKTALSNVKEPFLNSQDTILLPTKLTSENRANSLGIVTKEQIEEDLCDRGMVFGIAPDNKGVIKLEDVVQYVFNQLNEL
ncbi:hypothetical protein T190115A13A_80215 [Tenacibaculum sp. 190524A02b]|uniref:Uncharacterized protein n=1 Tax=Tenacibaculum vairaonense TaxID=3137860 RepID=A0ABM9PS45_9FLAO